ncbi:hypothetical protein I8F73_03205 [Enterococcus faecalis]|nr:hypothetical protein [Enterococcus faecalis]
MEENPIIAVSRKEVWLQNVRLGKKKKSVPKVGFSWSGEITLFITFYIIYLLNK